MQVPQFDPDLGDRVARKPGVVGRPMGKNYTRNFSEAVEYARARAITRGVRQTVSIPRSRRPGRPALLAGHFYVQDVR